MYLLSPCLVRISTVPFPKTVTWTLFPSVTSVLTEVSRLENRFKLPVMWLLQPESKYHMSLLHFDQKSDGRIVVFSTLPCRMYDTMNFFKRRWIFVGYPTSFQSVGYPTLTSRRLRDGDKKNFKKITPTGKAKGVA